MATVGTFCLVKNEKPWIEAHLKSWLPHVDQMVLFDGNSVDGTLEIIRRMKSAEHGRKIVLVEGMDPADLRDDYVRMFNDCLHALTTDYAIFAHPDMILTDPGNIRGLGKDIAYFAHMRSFAGEPGGQLYEIEAGRFGTWKNIYRLRNPDLGLHYFGHYGTNNEDCYFSKITGSQHEMMWTEKGNDYDAYPYAVGDSGIRINHFSDVRYVARRIGRMVSCLVNQGISAKIAESASLQHPRVTLKDGYGFKFKPVEYPANMEKVNA